MTYICDIKQLEKFVSILPPLDRSDIYFVSLSARNKYLTKEEREFYNLGRTEMFNRRLTSKEKYIVTIKQMSDMVNNYTTRNGNIIPTKALVFYANINPSSGIQALKMFNEKTNDLVFDSFTNKQSLTKFAKLDTLLMNCYQKSRSKKHFIDVDCDCHFHFIKPVLIDLMEHDVVFYVIQTKSGYHILIEASTITYNFTEVIVEQDMKVPDGEIVINTNAMVPIPGTLQAGYGVKFIEPPFISGMEEI